MAFATRQSCNPANVKLSQSAYPYPILLFELFHAGMKICLTAVVASISPVLAWLPGEHKHIFSRDGVNLFDRRSPFEAGSLSKRFLPNSYGNDKNKIRGVNLGSLFVLENWLADNVMSAWGCNSTSEFNCVSSLHDQSKANNDFQGHWKTWVNVSDFSRMVSYGLNTVRIPVGYWFYEQIVDSSEYFPQGGEAYLDQVVGYAKDAGLYVIIDLHGAPGAQVTDPDTGQYNVNPGFYEAYNYNRTYSFFSWLTNKIHTNPNYDTVGMIMLVNEPERLTDQEYSDIKAHTHSLKQTYYPTVISHIRAVERSLGFSGNHQLHIQMMGTGWGSGDPTTYLSNLTFVAYDEHAYVKYTAGITQTQSGYLEFSCNDDLSSDAPVIVGEWSLSVNSGLPWGSAVDLSKNLDWYRQWWAAQVVAYEKVGGWVFWTWKTTGSLNDPRWDYQKAVEAGIISTNIDDAYSMAPCTGVTNATGTANSTGNGTSMTSGADSVSPRKRLALVTIALAVLALWNG